MRLKIDTSQVKFRVAAVATPKQKSKNDHTQRMTNDGRPIWSIRLTASDTSNNRSEIITVEVAGDEPKLTFDESVQVEELVFAPWVTNSGNLFRIFRADSITAQADPRRAAAA